MPTAIKPDYFKDLRVLTKEEDSQPIELKEEQVLADLADLAGWKVLKEYIGDLKDQLDKLMATAMESGASYEEIGQKTIVTTLTKSYLDLVIERVSDAREAVTQSGE